MNHDFCPLMCDKSAVNGYSTSTFRALTDGGHLAEERHSEAEVKVATEQQRPDVAGASSRGAGGY